MLCPTPFELAPPGQPNAALVAASVWPDGLWHLYILQTRVDGSRIQLNVTVTDIIPLATEAMEPPGGSAFGAAPLARAVVRAPAAGRDIGGVGGLGLRPFPGGTILSGAGQSSGDLVVAGTTAALRGAEVQEAALIAAPFGQPAPFWGAEPPPWLVAAGAARPVRGVWETFWEPALGRPWYWHEASLSATYSHPEELRGALGGLD